MMTGLKKAIGMKSVKLMVVSVMYNFKSDPDMGIREIAIRRIPCACNDCLKQVD